MYKPGKPGLAGKPGKPGRQDTSEIDDLYKISVTGGYFTPAPVLISRFRGLSWMGLGLTPVGVGLEVCVGVVVVTMIKEEYTSSCITLSYRTIL